jgi:hypothetical protein
MIGDLKRHAGWILGLTLVPGAARAAESGQKPAQQLIAEVVSPTGHRRTMVLNDSSGHVNAELQSAVRLAVDPEACKGCKAELVTLLQDGEEQESWKGRSLPVALVGGHLPPAAASTVLVTVKVEDESQAVTKSDYVIRYSLSEGWWAVADTVAYAVTRQQGNTAIAGAGVFFDLPHWGPLNKTRGFLRFSLVVHLLPPAGKNEPADIGIAPIGISLFANRVVAGIGWNISRQGLRPRENNRYVYVGFSASQLLNPKP